MKLLNALIIFGATFLCAYAGNIVAENWVPTCVGGGAYAWDTNNQTFTFTHLSSDDTGFCFITSQNTSETYQSFTLSSRLQMNNSVCFMLEVLSPSDNRVDRFYIQKSGESKINFYSSIGDFDKYLTYAGAESELEVHFSHEEGTQNAEVELYVDGEMLASGSYVLPNTEGIANIAFGLDSRTDGDFSYTAIEFVPEPIPESAACATVFGALALCVLARRVRA